MYLLLAFIADWPTAVVVISVIATVAVLVRDGLGIKRQAEKPSGTPPSVTADGENCPSATILEIRNLRHENRALERRMHRLEGQFDALVHKLMDIIHER